MKYVIDRKIESLIEEIHQLSLEPCLLQSILQNVNEIFNCYTTGIIGLKTGQKAPALVDSFGIDFKFFNQYNQYFNKLDPTLTVLDKKPFQVIANHVTDRNIPKGDDKWREFAFDFIRPQNIVYTAAINIRSHLDEAQRSWIWTRTNKQGPFNEMEISILDRLGFHMRNAYARLEISKSHSFFRNEEYKKLSTLTQRELDVLKLIALGSNRASISNKLNISVHTVDEHRKHIRNKLEKKHLNDDIAKHYLNAFKREIHRHRFNL